MIVSPLRPGGRASARGERVVAALDVGSSKVACIIARLKPGARPEVLGVGHKLCVGVRQGTVAQMTATEQSIGAVVEQAERAAEAQVQSVYVNFACPDLGAQPLEATLELGGYPVEPSDLEQLHDLACARAADDASVLHALPAFYCIDGKTVVQDPRHFHARSVGVSALALHCETAPLRNLDTSIRRAHLDVSAVVAGPVATGMGCLLDEERDAGVALIEMGAGLTTVSVYARGALVGVEVLPAGGFDVVNELAVRLNTKRLHAERLLCLHGAVVATHADSRNMLAIGPRQAGDDRSMAHLSRLELTQLIRQPVLRLFEQADAALERLGFWRSGGRQLVLTGGLAQLQGLEPFAANIFQRDPRAAATRRAGLLVRVGGPVGLDGLPPALSGPAFATLAGLVRFASRPPVDIWRERPANMRVAAQGSWGKMLSILRARL